jgi:WD40 repeat protein
MPFPMRLVVLLVGFAAAVPVLAQPAADDPRAMQAKFQAEREQAVKARFPAEALARADELARRAEAALAANNPAAALRYFRDARWQLPYLPAGLPEHVVRVFGESRMRHSDRVNALAYSPDGTRIASCSKDLTVRIWDLGNGRELVTYRGHSTQPDDPTRAGTNVLGVTDVVFHPSNSKLIVSACGNQVHEWDAESGKLLRTLLHLGKTDKPIKALAFRPDGKFLAVGSDDGILRVVQLETGKVTFTSPSRNARIEKLAYSSNGVMIVLGDSAGQVAVYAPELANPLAMAVQGVDLGEVLGVAFTADNGAVFTCGRDQKAHLTAGPKPDGSSAGNTATRLRSFVGHVGAVQCLGLIPGGESLITGGEDKSVRVWEVTSGKQLRSFQGHMTKVSAVAARADGKQIASASEDGAIRLWDISTSDDHKALREATDSLWAVTYSPDGKRVAAAGADKTIRVYNPETGKLEATLSGAKAAVTSLAFFPDSNRLAAAGGDKLVTIWDVDKKQVLTQLTGHDSAILSVAVSEDGELIVTGSADSTVRGFRPSEAKALWQWKGRPAVCAVAIRKGKKTVAAGLADGTLTTLDVSSGTPKEPTTQSAHVAGVACLAYSPDGQRLASVGGDGAVRIWSVAANGSLTPLARFEGQSRPASVTGYSPLTGVAFSPDGRYVAAVGADAVVRVWDVETKSEVRGLRGHTDWITAVAFSPDGRFIATVGVDQDSVVRIFELPPLDTSSSGGHLLAVHAVAVSSDGRTVATASTDQTIKLWDLATGKQLGTLIGNADVPFAVTFLGPDGLVMGGSLPTGSTGRLHFWRIKPPQLLTSIPTGEVYAVVALADGSKLAAWASRPAVGDAVKNNTFELYDAKGTLLTSLTDKGRNIRAATFSADLSWAIAGDDQGTLRIWDLAKKDRLGADWPLFVNPLADLGLTADKKTLVAVDEQGKIKVADVAKREALPEFTAHAAGVRALVVAPTGSSFVTVGRDHEVKAWSLDPATLKDPKPLRSWKLPVPVNGLVYTPDGKFVVTANADGTAYVLELP